MELGTSARRLLNPGSVGQPRDGDPRAAWLLLDFGAGRASFRRVAYPVERTQEEIRESGLPESLARAACSRRLAAAARAFAVVVVVAAAAGAVMVAASVVLRGLGLGRLGLATVRVVRSSVVVSLSCSGSLSRVSRRRSCLPALGAAVVVAGLALPARARVLSEPVRAM